MKRALSGIAALGLLALGACAQKGGNKTSSYGDDRFSWDQLAGVLFAGNQPICSVSYMGALLGFTVQANPGEQIAFAVTASHCVQGISQQQNPALASAMKIVWFGLEESPVISHELTSGQTSYFGDFALLRIAPPKSLPYLQSHRVDAPQVGMQVTVLGLQMTGGQVVPQPINCSVQSVAQVQQGFELSGCTDVATGQPLTSQASPGLSGALIVNQANRLLGVFKGSQSGTFTTESYRFSAGALAWIPQSREAFGLPQQSTAGSIAIPYELCSRSLKGECGLFVGQDAMLRQCASAWGNKTTVLGLGAVVRNGEVCRLNPNDLVSVIHMMGDNNASFGGSSGGF